MKLVIFLLFPLCYFSSPFSPMRETSLEQEDWEILDDAESYDLNRTLSVWPWLRNYLTGNQHIILPQLPNTPLQISSNTLLPIAFGRPDEPFQECVAPGNKKGHCRFIQHCLFPQVVSDYYTFLNYFCVIEGIFVGICCPDERYSTTTAKPTTTQKPIEGCGVRSPSQKIVGGVAAEKREFPWMAALLLNDFTAPRHYCGGCLVTMSHVLTAAHCVDGFAIQAIIARLGEYNFREQEDDSRDFVIRTAVMHEEYNRETYANDLAMLTLKTPAMMSDSIRPICLPRPNDLFVGNEATVIGWGRIYYGGPVSSTLLKVKIPVWKNEDCQAAYSQIITDVFLCAGEEDGGKDSCEGDSGGPLMLPSEKGVWSIIGIVSFGIKCAEPDIPGVYTRVNKFLDWISRQTSN